MAAAAGWYVYVVQCRDGTLYTGVATDVARRLSEHRAGAPRGARYLRGRGPFELVLAQRVGAHGVALRVENAIKALSKRRKEALVRGETSIADLIKRCSGPGRGRVNTLLCATSRKRLG